MNIDIKSLIKEVQNRHVEPEGKLNEHSPAQNNGSQSKKPNKQETLIDTKSNDNTSKSKRKEVLKQNDNFSSNSIVNKINSLDKADITNPMLHIRVKPEIHRKLLLYGLGKLSIQSIVNYAIVNLLEDKEMEQLLKNIKNGME